MSSSIAEEIMKLHQLMQQGVLTEAEFLQAKSKLLGTSIPSSAVDQQPQSSQVVAFPEEAAIQLARGLDGSDFFDESISRRHHAAFAQLTTILENILQFPGDAKYRRLKFSNPRLSAGLFSDPGSVPFLKAIGFDHRIERIAGIRGDEEEEIMVMDQLPDAGIIRQALAEIRWMKDRDEKAEVEAAQQNVKRRAVALRLREEKWKERRLYGTDSFVDDLLADSLLGDHGTEALVRAEETLNTLAIVVDNAHQHERFRTLRYTNSSATKFLHSAPGALEFLVAYCGFVIGEEGVSLPPSVPVQLEEWKQKLHQLGELVKGEVAAAAAKEREEARAAAAAEREREKAKAERKRMRELQQQAAGSGGGKKIPIAEALMHLLGKQQDEEQ